MSLIPAPTEWSPLEEQFHTWDIIIRNPPTGPGLPPQTKALSLWAGISITETHEGIRTQIEVNAEEPVIPFIKELVTDFLFYRDRELRYRLRVVDSEDVLTRDAATVRFDCVSYDKLLERRILHEDWLLDDGDINAAWRLIDYTQRKETFGITRGTTQPGSRRQRALDAGDDILASINDFAQADGGFDWWIDAELKFWAVKPQRGKIHTVQWQLGGEVAEMTRLNPIEDYASLVMATGAQSEVRIPRPDGEEDVYPPPNPQIVQLSSKPLGLWEMTTSDTDVITSASLLEKANWHLGDKGSVRPSYKVMLEPGVWQPDVGVGDIINLRINTVRANVKVPIRIEELQITCTSDGAEAVSMAVRAQKPETPIGGGEEPLPTLMAPGDAPVANGRTVARHRLSEADDLGALLRSLRKRLDRAERSRGIGGGLGAHILDGEGPPPLSIGSTGDYYVDTYGQQLYGPKSDLPPLVQQGQTWTYNGPANNVYAGEVGITCYANEDFDIIGFRYAGSPLASPTLTVNFWDYNISEVIYRTSVDGVAGSGGWVEIPPIRVLATAGHRGSMERVTCMLGGAAVPIRKPRAEYTSQPAFMGVYFGTDLAGLGQPPMTGNNGSQSLDVQLLCVPVSSVVVGPEHVVEALTPPVLDAHISGELGFALNVLERSTLVGWKWWTTDDTSSEVTFTVWTSQYRYYSETYSNIKRFPLSIRAQFTATIPGAGLHEFRLATPIRLDPMGGADTLEPEGVTISVGGASLPYSKQSESTTVSGWPDPGWYEFLHEMTYHNPVIGEYPQDLIPGSAYPNYDCFYLFPILQQDVDGWPLSNEARSGGLSGTGERVELHRNKTHIDTYDDWAGGLRFYSGGPSHDPRGGIPGEEQWWWSCDLHYEGYSGVELATDDWWHESEHVVWPDPQKYTRKYAWYDWAYDYAYWEQDANLDDNATVHPGSYYMTFGEQSTWDDYAYWDWYAYGPYHGAGVLDEDGAWDNGVADGGAGFGCQVSDYGPESLMSASANMVASANDGIWGTSLQVTPRVIQACFPPDAPWDTWWSGGVGMHGLTPKGCVTPLITAASATATAEDEPWQKQFFRQMGTNSVAFTDGLGQIVVPTGMGVPCVVNAQVDGITAGGAFVAQARRVSDNLISVALNTAHTGSVTINWFVEHAALTFGTPPPSIDTIRNPGSTYIYGPFVEYNAGGGAWPFELISWGNTFQPNCVLKDFTGATVGGPFTIENVPIDTLFYQRVLWSAGRDWYLPGESQQYRMTNPDGQVSAWTTINWVEPEVLLRTVPRGVGVTAVDDAEGIPVDRNRYSNNPINRITVNPLQPDPRFVVDAQATDKIPGRGPDSPRERGPKGLRDDPQGRLKGGRTRRDARREQLRLEREGKAPRSEPPGSTDTPPPQE